MKVVPIEAPPESVCLMAEHLYSVPTDPAEAFQQAVVAAGVVQAISGRKLRVVKRSSTWLRFLTPGAPMGFVLPVPYFGSWVVIRDDLWDTKEGRVVLAHELRHVLDAIKFTPLLFVLSYLLAFPVLLTARAQWEWRGAQAGLEEMIRVYGHIPDAQLDALADSFVGWRYGFMAVGRDKWRKKFGDLAKKLQDNYATEVREALSVFSEALSVSTMMSAAIDSGLADVKPAGRA